MEPNRFGPKQSNKVDPNNIDFYPNLYGEGRIQTKSAEEEEMESSTLYHKGWDVRRLNRFRPKRSKKEDQNNIDFYPNLYEKGQIQTKSAKEIPQKTELWYPPDMIFSEDQKIIKEHIVELKASNNDYYKNIAYYPILKDNTELRYKLHNNELISITLRKSKPDPNNRQLFPIKHDNVDYNLVINYVSK